MSSNSSDDQQRQNLLKIAIIEIAELPDRTEVIEFIRQLALKEISGTSQSE